MMTDYSIFYKRQLPLAGAWGSDERWDLFISAYVPADRTKLVFDRVEATHKYWLLFPEYGYSPTDHPGGKVFQGAADEATFIPDFWESLPRDAVSFRICVDITGF